MSADLRNSLRVWGSVTLFVLIFFAALSFAPEVEIPRWVSIVVILIGLLNIARFVLGLWKRRYREVQADHG